MSEDLTVTTPARILVPVDLSRRSESAVAYAAMLAGTCGAELVLVVNVNLPERAVLEEFATDEKINLEEAAVAALHSLSHRYAPGIKASGVAVFAEFPADGILDAAEREAADMIVIASHGRAGMRRWLLGSVAEKIARGAEVPVVIVPAREQDDR